MAPPTDKPKKRDVIRGILDFIFGFKNKHGEILDSWIYSADEFKIDPLEFYRRVEQKLEGLRIPGMQISREEFAEGGLLSNQRIYLRLMRERFAIDTCAAPFGTHFFFSCRLVNVPARVYLWHLVALFFIFDLIGVLLLHQLGFIFTVIALVGLLFALAEVLRNAAGSTDLDTLLLKIPVIAPIYEYWFRVETYYRIDTRTLYKSLLPDAIKAAVEETCADKGIKLVRQDPNAPIFREL
jgi:hypothetical protein